MIRIFFCLAVVFALLAPSAQAQQPTRLEAIVKRGTLRVGMTGDYAPFGAFDPATSTFRGFDVDMADSLGKALGVRIEFVRTAWPRLTEDFEADRFDIAMGGISITPERERARSQHLSCRKARRRSRVARIAANSRPWPISTTRVRG